MARIPDIDDALEDKDIEFPEDDWEWGYVAGIEQEQERILKLLDTTRMCNCKPSCRTDINIYAFVLEELGIDLFKLTKGELD